MCRCGDRWNAINGLGELVRSLLSYGGATALVVDLRVVLTRNKALSKSSQQEAGLALELRTKAHDAKVYLFYICARDLDKSRVI